jgi:hypothetical protein
MTVTAPHPLALALGFEADYAAFGRWLDEHPEIAARLSHIHSVAVRGHTPAERIAELEARAAEMGARTEPRGPGYEAAAVRFGRVVVEAHHSDASFLRLHGGAA